MLNPVFVHLCLFRRHLYYGSCSVEVVGDEQWQEVKVLGSFRRQLFYFIPPLLYLQSRLQRCLSVLRPLRSTSKEQLSLKCLPMFREPLFLPDS